MRTLAAIVEGRNRDADWMAGSQVTRIRLCGEQDLQERGIVSALAAAVADRLRNWRRAMLVTAGGPCLHRNHQRSIWPGNR